VSARSLRKLVLLAAVGAAAYWIYRTRPSVTTLVDDLTRPLFESKAAVKESEYKRVVAEAGPAISQSEEIALGTLHENMKDSEVRDILGPPEQIEQIKDDGREQVRWTYKRLGRILVFENRRVVSITVR
jgi:hypothetical protein